MLTTQHHYVNKNMHKCHEFISYFICLTIYVFPSCSSFTCIHDDVTITKPAPAVYTRSLKYQDIKNARLQDPKLFESLNIHYYLDSLDPSISFNTIFNLDQSLKKVDDFLKKTIKVRKVERPFRLERKGCTKRWQYGENRGMCSSFKGEEEVCQVKGVTYQIPERFLNELKVYNFEGNKPSYISPAGPGLLDENFIIFVTGFNTPACTEQMNVFAYGTFCRLDPKTNQPLAGIINLCPAYFNKKIYPAQHYYNILMHETLHILGFTSSLFQKFLPCEKGTPCNIPRNIIQDDSNGIGRLVFPEVIKKMQQHFSCSESDFGGPMAVSEQKDENATDTQPKYSSHWHPILMYGSIMTPKFTDSENILVDQITLAVLASTGWYKVDFEQADKYSFGKGEGCEFGMNSSCNNEYLCNPSKNATGCDMLHKSIGKCQSLVPYHDCGIYMPYTEEDCEKQAEKEYSLDVYALNYTRKCFLLNPSDSPAKPSCLPVKCTSPNSYSILYNVTWYSCQFQKEIIIEGDRMLTCAEGSLFCADAPVPFSRQACLEESYFYLPIRMRFKLPPLKDLLKNRNFKNVKIASLRGVAGDMNIPINFIANSSLSVFKKVYLDFAVCPPASLNEEEITKLVKKVQSFLDNGTFRHILKGPTDMVISSENIEMLPMDIISFSDHDGFRVLLAFPFILGVFLVITTTASLVRLYFTQKNKPRRNESQAPQNKPRTGSAV